jgi:amino-acid N-acetyltransferase
MNARIVETNESLHEVTSLLKASNLPFKDIQPGNIELISYSNNDGKIVGSGGLEFYGSFALLRSVAVEESQRGQSLGTQIVKDLLERARKRSVMAVYLLTETAEGFFLKHGFASTRREDAPESLRASTEFTSVCPATAVCMVFRFL